MSRKVPLTDLIGFDLVNVIGVASPLARIKEWKGEEEMEKNTGERGAETQTRGGEQDIPSKD